jgi:MFS family permease
MDQAVQGHRGQSQSQHDTFDSWRSLLLVTFAFSLSYIDRQLLNLLVDPIRRSLSLDDTQFSLIQGAAFVTAYLLAAPVFGRLVDVTNRRNVLIFGVSVWSVCTALCGFANTFTEMFLARFGVGMAEACIFPVAMSVIGDSFSPGRMPRAMSIYTLGSGLGGGFSLLAGGAVLAFSAELRSLFPALASFQGWQMAFIVVGLPGLLYALFLFTMREPKRTRTGIEDVTERALSLREVASMFSRRGNFYARIYASIGMIAIVQLGFASWLPSFMIRTHGVDAAHAGYVLGALGVSVGSVGTLTGPWISQWVARLGHTDAPLRTAAFSAIGMLICCAALPLSPSEGGARRNRRRLLLHSCSTGRDRRRDPKRNAEPNARCGRIGPHVLSPICRIYDWPNYNRPPHG